MNRKFYLPKTFLEQYALYRRFELALPDWPTTNINWPQIHRYCDTCRMVTTFESKNQFSACSPRESMEPPTSGVVMFRNYDCAACEAFSICFAVRVSDDRSHIMKVGQYPAWSIEVEKDKKEILGEHLPIYKNGLICESQGYGIGAFAYYRRTVELVIDQLLDRIAAMFKTEIGADYEDMVRRVREAKNAEDKIAIAKEILPQSLRPGGANPLSALYDALSSGIHAASDGDCLEDAAAVRGVLVYLIEGINQRVETRERERQYHDGIRILLEKKSRRK